MLSEFENLGLQPQFVQVLEQLGFEHPTPIQLEAIPALLAGRNVVGQAQTGTGKTAAFALPMLQKINTHVVPSRKGIIQALVLAPTRELAIQVAEATHRMAQNTSLRVTAVYGGQSYHIQIRALERGVDIVVGTPGRLLDLIRQNFIDLSQVQYLVLDEADEMLAMGFIEDVETILGQVPAERQIALFSATLPESVRRLADRYVSSPQQIRINPTRPTVAETEQTYCRVYEESKLPLLTRLLEAEEVKSALIFTRTKIRAQELSDAMNNRNCPAEALHGDLNQARREAVLDRFRQGAISILVATDVAARGLDIDDVTHVINYDVPDDAEDYVHRIGRTGRAGRKGSAITFITPRERGRLKVIEAYTHQPIKERAVPTRQEILARRDERFLQRLSEQLGKGKISTERALIARLADTSFDLVEIAAAAIRLARAGEVELSLDEVRQPAPETATRQETGRKNRRTNDAWALQTTLVAQNSTKGGRKIGRKGFRDLQNESRPKARPAKGQQEPGMVRLRMNLGDKHGVRPSDVVGAIASEVGIPGRAIGEIAIHTDHTFVDVSEKHVRQVLMESLGQYSLRGNPVLLTLAN